MKLTDLEPQFLVNEGNTHRYVDTIAEAQGVMFLCPVCWKTNSGPVGTHMIVCWSSSRGVAPDVLPGPGRWTLEGTGYADLTLGCEPGKSRSVLITSGCMAHFFVTGGEVG